MFSLSTPKGGADAAVRYYLEAVLEYYLLGLEKQGLWCGQGAKTLGLFGQVDRDSFRNLLNGFSADGQQKLVQNAGDKDRQCYWDGVFNAPKSVSVLWAMSPESIRQAIERAHKETVAETLAWAEDLIGFTRRGQGGKTIERCQLVFATFLEGTSRDQDPHLHSHSLLANIGVRQDGTTGALWTKELFRLKMAIGQRYQLGLAARLQQRLGLAIEPDRVGFRIVGVPQDACRAFSKRRQKIEQVMAARGVRGAMAAKHVAVDTRQKKHEVPAGILFPAWHQEGRTLGWGPEQAVALLEKARQRKHEPVFEAGKSTAMEQASTRTFPRRLFPAGVGVNAAADTLRPR